MTDDLAARIAALVDDQLEQEPTGYDYSVGIERCRCGDEWHGLPVTQAMRRMRRAYGLGHADAMDGYTIDQDTSPIMCPGSDVQGPLRHSLPTYGYPEAFREAMDSARYYASQIRIPQQRYSQNSIDWLMQLGEPERQGPSANQMIYSAGTAFGDLAPVMMTDNPWMSFPTIEDGDPVAYEDIHTGEIHRYRWGQREAVLTPADVALMGDRLQSLVDQLRESMGSFSAACRDAREQIDQMGDGPMMRALPRPSHTPPFWVQDRRRSGRSGRNHL